MSVSSIQVHCPLCHAKPGFDCTYTNADLSPHSYMAIKGYHASRSALAGQTNPRDVLPDNVTQQPREHPVPCQSCRKPTWHYDALCDACRSV